MVLQEDIRNKLVKKSVTKIHDQPSDCDTTQLERELAKMCEGITTDLGGGKHGHVGIGIPKDDYIKCSEGGAKFDIPMHPAISQLLFPAWRSHVTNKL